ncbi:MAG: nuclear transport factor 2 family protein [Bryobacteraceae bacterium]
MYSARMQSESIEQRLWRLETDLLTSTVRRDPEALMNLLAEEFCEFGRSGHIYSRDEIVRALQTESPRQFSVTDFSVRVLSQDAALVTYVAHQSEPGKDPSTSLRSSLWVLRDSRWQMLFHQGTRVGS